MHSQTKSTWHVTNSGNDVSHVKESDMEVLFKGNRYGWDINLRTQPPDFNILDLGLFRSIQSATWDKDIKDIADIVKTVHPAR